MARKNGQLRYRARNCVRRFGLPARQVASAVPLDRLLIETDSPYLAPVPHRGKTNEPSFVRHVAEEVARLRNVSVEEVAAATTENFQRLFKVTLDPRP